MDWDELLAGQPDRFETERLDSEHPLFIGYTSGTTGRPKGVLHVHGGFLVKIAEEVAYQVDLHPGEILYWVTDLGWIMGPFEIVGALALGATVLLTEGAPTHPGPGPPVGDGRTPRRHHARRLADADPRADPVRRAARPRARPVVAPDPRVSTGEPWNPDPYRWLSREVGGDRLPIINLSGGTEVGACFLSPHPITPLKTGTLRGPALGMDVDVWGPDGKPVPARRGRRARLPTALALDDARHLGRRGALPRDVLEPLARRVGARRLGEHRRGRLLVPARPLRRHAQRRRQAPGPRRGRVGPRLAPSGRRVGRDRRPARGEGRDDLVRRRAAPRRGAER